MRFKQNFQEVKVMHGDFWNMNILGTGNMQRQATGSWTAWSQKHDCHGQSTWRWSVCWGQSEQWRISLAWAVNGNEARSCRCLKPIGRSLDFASYEMKSQRKTGSPPDMLDQLLEYRKADSFSLYMTTSVTLWWLFGILCCSTCGG